MIRRPPRSPLFPYTTLSRSGRVRPLHAEALRPRHRGEPSPPVPREQLDRHAADRAPDRGAGRSEEHTSELQSQSNLVCRLLLENKKKTNHENSITFMITSCT